MDGVASYWEATGDPIPVLEPLADSLAVDVAVVGAGFTGLAAAYYLARRGASVVVLERDQVAFGASGRNGGQVLSGWPKEMVTLAERFGRDTAKVLWSISEDALTRVQTMVRDEDIACGLECPGHLEAADTPEHAALLERELGLVGAWNPDRFVWWDRQAIRERVGAMGYVGGLYDPRSMAFHPRNYAVGVACAVVRRGGRIFIRTPLVQLTPSNKGLSAWDLRTESGPVVSARHVILATNAYPPPFLHALRSRILPVDSAQIAVELETADRLPNPMPTVSDTKQELNYYRRVGERTVLFGGRALSRELREGRFDSLQVQFRRVFPGLDATHVTHQWAGRIALSRDFIPHVRCLSDGLWAAAGYAGHGAALSTEMGYLLAKAVTEGTEDPRLETLLALPWPPYPAARVLRLLFPAVLRMMDARLRRDLERR